MRKLLASLMGFSGFLFPLFAQVDHDYRDKDVVPVESLTLTKDQIPSAVIKAVDTDFTNETPLTWGRFPYALENYGWVVKQDAPYEKLDHYEIYIKSKDGGDIFAVYTPDGTILHSRSLYKDIALPVPVEEALAKSQYKDWKIVGDKEIIKYFKDKTNVEEHFRITVEKNNQKRSISFNYEEPTVKEQK